MSIPNTFNPSDYEFLIRSLSEGSHLAKGETLRRFITLASSDKKQFSLYAKRIVLAVQQLICEQKEEINLATSMLILQIININPKDIEYYLRTKLLKKIVINLGDAKPQLRKSSHFCILAYIKTFHSIDQILSVYTQIGHSTPEGQLRQKIINSFQSIAITEPAALNWNSNQFKKMFQMLLQKLKDESPYVQKASEQCLLTLSRMQEVSIFAKKLAPAYAGIYRIFCETQREIGNLQSVQFLNNQKHIASQKNISHPQFTDSHKSQKNLNSAGIHLQKINSISRQQSINKQALIDRIEQIRRNAQTPKIAELQLKQEKKNVEDQRQRAESLLQKLRNNQALSHRETGLNKEPMSIQQAKIQLLKKAKTISPLEIVRVKEKEAKAQTPKIHPVVMATKSEKVQNIFGKKLLQDLKNQKEWKVRLQAIEQLQTKFQIYKDAFQIDGLVKNLFPLLVKLLSDQNFKIVTITLKVLEDFFKMAHIPLELIVPQVVDKLADGKVSLRQGVARLIRSQYLRDYNPIWLDSLLELLKKIYNASLKEQILGIITRLYEDDHPRYSLQKLVDSICPMMDDPKTKVKIRTLDLLVLIASSTQRVDTVKTILISKLNQVYYEMFLEKVAKEIKYRVTPRLVESEPPPREQSRTLSFPSLRKNNKNSAKTTTSTSLLEKYSKTVDTKPIQRAVSYTIPKDSSLISRQPISLDQPFSQREQSSFTPNQSVRKKPIKSFKRKIQKTLQSKLATTHTVDSDSLRPFADPERETKNLLSDLKSDDWQTAYEGLNKFRRLLKHHPQALTPSIVRPLSVQISILVQSLRSSISKNAVVALGECAKQFAKTLDPELDAIFTRLMRKTLDTNVFISQQVKKTLILVSTSCNETRVVNCLQNYYTSRAIPVKVNLLSILQVLINIPRVVQKQIQKIMIILVAFTNQGAYQIRDKTKILILKLLQIDKTGKVMRALPAGTLEKFKKKQVSEIIPNNESMIKVKEAFPALQSQIAQPKQKFEVQSVKKKQKILIFPKELDQLDQILLTGQSTQWKIRQVAITKLVSLIKSYPQQITQHKYNTRVIELFAKMANDPNSKVATSALNSFAQIINLVPRMIEANLSVLTSQIFSCFASQKTQVRELSLNLFDTISEKTQHWMLIQHLCNGALYGPAKARGNILVKLIKVFPQAFRQRRSAVQKHIYTFVNKIAEQAKADVTTILKQLIKMIISLGGQQANSSLRQPAKNLISN